MQRGFLLAHLKRIVNRIFVMSVTSKAPIKRKAETIDGPVTPRAKQGRLTTFFTPTPQSASKYMAPSDNFLINLLKETSWRRALMSEMKKPYFKQLTDRLEEEYQKGVRVFPPRDKIFNAFNTTSLDDVKVVIIGQDPYHGVGQAHGLCFSVEKGVPPPPSLQNIYKELEADIDGFKAPSHGCLQPWAERGVFLLNASLTVRAHQANSHSSFGWQTFTDFVIKTISERCDGVVFMLWGGFARKKVALIDRKKHTIIEAAHPSPLSSHMFFGCKCFSKANEALKKAGRKPIDWTLPMTI